VTRSRKAEGLCSSDRGKKELRQSSERSVSRAAWASRSANRRIPGDGRGLDYAQGGRSRSRAPEGNTPDDQVDQASKRLKEVKKGTRIVLAGYRGHRGSGGKP